MVSTIPTYSGKTMGKRIPRDLVLPIFVCTVALFGLVISFPFEALALATLLYLALIPVGVAHYGRLSRASRRAEAGPLTTPGPGGGEPPFTA
jgi:CDP-diacylglycerol--serine O-phosphatidyltransferase